MPGGEHRAISSILERCTWPKLRHLELKGDGVGGGRELGTINRLLARHPSIEVLSLGLSLRFCDLPGASLPNLRALECNGNNAALILSHSTPGSLRTLRIHRGWDVWYGSLKGFRRLLEPIGNHASVERFIFMAYPMDKGMVRAVIKTLPSLKTLNGCICDGDVQSLSVPRIPHFADCILNLFIRLTSLQAKEVHNEDNLWGSTRWWERSLATRV